MADVFFKAGLIESWGRGTLKIINECKAKNIPEPKFVGEFGGFSITFTKGKIAQETAEGSKSLHEEIMKNPSIQAKDLMVIFDNRPFKTIER